MTIEEMLDELAELKAQQDALRLDWETKRDTIMAPVMAELHALDAEYTPMMCAAQDKAAEIEIAVRAEVLKHGASVNGTHLQAVFTKGRVSWDTKALEGYSVAHPEIQAFVKVGEPSVSIRVRK